MFVTRSSTALLILYLVACGCESKKSEGTASTPTGNAAATPAGEAAAKGTNAAATGQNSFPASDKFDLVPLAVGQWIRMVVMTEGQPPAQTFIRIVGKEGDAFWYEIESNTPNGTTIIQFLMEGASRENFSKGSIKKMKMRAGAAPVQEFSGPAMAAMSAVMDNYISMIGKPNIDKAQRADATVKAGEFKGCFVHDIDQNIMGMSMKIKSWNHPAVPINGFVRSEGTANGSKTSTVLEEMHMDGAKSKLQ